MVPSAGTVHVVLHTPLLVVPEDGVSTIFSICPSLGPPESNQKIKSTHCIAVGSDVNGIDAVTTVPGHQYQEETVIVPGWGKDAGNPTGTTVNCC